MYHDRNAPIEANGAYRKAIALNPENAILYANYARFLMDNDQVKAAKEIFEQEGAQDISSASETKSPDVVTREQGRVKT